MFAHTAQGVGASVQHQPPKASGQYTLQSVNVPPIHQFDTGMKFCLAMTVLINCRHGTVIWIAV